MCDKFGNRVIDERCRDLPMRDPYLADIHDLIELGIVELEVAQEGHADFVGIEISR